MPFNQPANGFRLPEAYMRPPVMAIGDSLYNGMRSATINAEYARTSVPALVAGSLAPDYRFRWPRYPESLLVNLEETLWRAHLLNFISSLKRTCELSVESAHRYARCDYGLREPVSAWDNISISGAEIEHLTEWPCRRWNDEVQRIMPKFSQVRSIDDLAGLGPDLMQLHMGLNGRFLLNPANERALDPLTPLDWVNLRKPKVLLVSIGANHGLIDITLNGSEAPQHRRDGNGLRSLRQWAADMAGLANQLTALPREVEAIYINTLPLPSTVPNLMYPYNPQAFMKVELRANEDDYFPVYENRLGGPSDYTQYTGAELHEIDREVLAINEAMIANVRKVFQEAGDARVQFFRLDHALKRYDGKHVDALKVRERRPEIDLEADRQAYSNEAITIGSLVVWDWVREGGVGSLDNHHPSGLGYAVFARELLAFMQKQGLGVDLTKAVISENGDRVLSDPPEAYQTLFRILYKIRRHKAGLPWQPDKEEALGRRGTATARPEAAEPPLTAEERETEPLADYMGAILGKNR